VEQGKKGGARIFGITSALIAEIIDAIESDFDPS
jgi:hypothetical protein|tara:strand:+ start:88 stop:189 length:102 start_codon:yes stop_codon:yes gene_type:complete